MKKTSLLTAVIFAVSLCMITLVDADLLKAKPDKPSTRSTASKARPYRTNNQQFYRPDPSHRSAVRNTALMQSRAENGRSVLGDNRRHGVRYESSPVENARRQGVRFERSPVMTEWSAWNRENPATVKTKPKKKVTKGSGSRKVTFKVAKTASGK